MLCSVRSLRCLQKLTEAWALWCAVGRGWAEKGVVHGAPAGSGLSCAFNRPGGWWSLAFGCYRLMDGDVHGSASHLLQAVHLCMQMLVSCVQAAGAEAPPSGNLWTVKGWLLLLADPKNSIMCLPHLLYMGVASSLCGRV